MEYSEHPEYVVWFGFILFFDVLSMIPFALLRHLQKAKLFALIRSLGIFINIGLNILYIVYLPIWIPEGNAIFNPDLGIGYVFIANLVASAFMLLLLLPQSVKYWSGVSKTLWKSMINYSWPLILVGLAGIVNETFDRVALNKLLTTDNPKFDIGVYGAFYKLSIIITIFIQAFRYAAEPFFFERAKGDDAKKVYAEVMNYFLLVCISIALFTLLFLELIAPIAIRSKEYFDHPDGLRIVAPLLLANIFLGVVYNLSIWFKVEEKNTLGALISASGAAITIVCLFVFVPKFGFIAAAYTTLLAYTAMSVMSYLLGQKHYKVPYELNKIGILLGLGVLFYFIDLQFLDSFSIWNMVLKSMIGILYILVGYRVVIGAKKT